MQPGLQCISSVRHLGAPLRLLRGAAGRGRSAGRQDVKPLLGVLNGVRMRDEVGRQRRTHALLRLVSACIAWSSAISSSFLAEKKVSETLDIAARTFVMEKLSHARRSTASCTPPAARKASQLASAASAADAVLPLLLAAAAAGGVWLSGGEAAAGCSAACSTASSVCRSGRDAVRSVRWMRWSSPVNGPVGRR